VGMHLISFILLLYTRTNYRIKGPLSLPSGNMAFLFDMMHMVSVKSDISSYVPYS